MRHIWLTMVTLVVAALSCTIAQAQSDTNQIMGQLGYAVGTELTIEGIFGGGKNSWILVTKINGTNLIPNIRIASNLQHPGHNLQTQTNIICRLKGCERTGVVPNKDPGQQAAPGRSFMFLVTEVLAPDGLKIRGYCSVTTKPFAAESLESEGSGGCRTDKP